MSANNTLEFDTPYRVHTSYIWLGAVRSFFVIFCILIAWVPSLGGFAKIPEVGEFLTNSILLVTLGVVGLIVICYLIALFYHLWSYKFLSYTIHKDEINIKYGIFVKKNFHIPYRRIQTVDLQASFLQRIVGVCSVSIDTAGGAANARIKIPYVQQTSAEVLRLYLFSLKKVALNEATFEEFEAQLPEITSHLNVPTKRGKKVDNVLDLPSNVIDEMGSIIGGKGIADEAVGHSFGLKNSEVILSALTGRHTLICLCLVFITVYVAIVLQDMFIIPAYTGNDVVILWMQKYFGGGLIWFISLSIFLIIVAIWFGATLSDAFNNAGFESRRKGTRVEVEHGLFQHSTQSLDIDKIQEIKVKQGLLRRMIGYARISVLTITSNASGTNEEKSRAAAGIVLHPFIKLSSVEATINELLPEIEFSIDNPCRVANVALRRGIIRNTIVKNAGFWCIVAYALFLISLNVGLFGEYSFIVVAYVPQMFIAVVPVCVLVMLGGLANAIIWYKESRYAFTDHFVQITRSGLHRIWVSAPRSRVQWIGITVNPFQRAARTSTLYVRTAAGVGGTTTRLIDLTDEEGKHALEWIKPRKSVSEC